MTGIDLMFWGTICLVLIYITIINIFTPRP